MKKKIKVLIVDDHFVVRIGLLTSLKMDDGFNAVGEASTARQALELYRQHPPDVVLMDLRLPDMSGIEATAALCREFPGTKIIIISSFDAQEDVYRAFKAGALGYLRKDVLGEELFRAIKTVAGGGKFVPPEIARSLADHTAGPELTPRELEVLRLLIKGLSNKEIGAMLGASEFTAKFHVKNILAKLQVSDRTEAASAAFERGIIH